MEGRTSNQKRMSVPLSERTHFSTQRGRIHRLTFWERSYKGGLKDTTIEVPDDKETELFVAIVRHPCVEVGIRREITDDVIGLFYSYESDRDIFDI